MKAVRIFGGPSTLVRSVVKPCQRSGGLGVYSRASISSRPINQYQARSFIADIPRSTHSKHDSPIPPKQRDSKAITAGILAFTTAVAALGWTRNGPDLNAEAPPAHQETKDAPNSNLFRLDEIRKHGADSERPWIIKGTGVYDITDWIESHPGGKVVLRAAGSSVEPYWNIFTIHKKDDVYQILEQFRIGDVDPLDLVDGCVPQEQVDDPFREDPERDSRLVYLTEKPCNAETPASGLNSFITDTPLFYVRHHFWVPPIDPSSYKITIDLGDGSDEKTYTLDDLRTKFPQHTITAVLQCSGNRRSHMSEGSGREASGLKWDVGAISNAQWRGPRLRDVLRDAGLNLDDPPEDIQHAQFSGEDAYGASVPIDKVMDARGDVLLACEMNGKILPPDHGYPVRVLVPGITGARSVKWVNRITLSEDESESQWQRRDYKCFGPNQGRDAVNWDNAPSIQETPVQSAITNLRHLPNPGSIIEGYAVSGGGRRIIRVDVSTDNGKTWDQAEILPDQSQGKKAWSWALWKYHCGRRLEPGSTVVVKAIDETYNVQPDTHGPTFNFRGNLANAWHRVRVED